MPPNDRPPDLRLTEALRIESQHGIATPAQRAVASEVAVSFIYGDAPYAVMMASPGDAEDFAFGFSLTEGIVRAASDIRAVRVARQDKGLEIHVELTPGRFHEHLARRRAIAGRTSCGLCGIETIDQLPQAEKLKAATPIAPRAVFAALAKFDRNQNLNALTHAVHGAAFCTRDGAIRALREDVGRHNALDKLIGALIREGVSPRDGFVLVTSRASFEMVEKTAIFGAPALIAISAPTTLAIERAQALGLTLGAIARADSMMVFSGAFEGGQAAGREIAAS